MVVSIPLCSPPTSGNGGEEEGQYRLLELPEEIARLIEAAQEKQTSAEANNLSGEHKRKRNRCDEGEREWSVDARVPPEKPSAKSDMLLPP